MLISLLIFLVSNAVTLARDRSILFSRLVINSLLFASFLAFYNLFTQPFEKGIGIYGGLFNITTFTQTFNIFIFLISATILVLTAFYPRKVFIAKHSSMYKLLTRKLTYNKNSISNKTLELFRIIEYALVRVFIICGAESLGVPPLIGFFAKQMVLSAALYNGDVFITLLAILTSVIGAGYYLNLIKQIFFFKHDCKINPEINNLNLVRDISTTYFKEKENQILNNETVSFDPNYLKINGALSGTISILTMVLILFIYIPGEWFNIVSILTPILFKA